MPEIPSLPQGMSLSHFGRKVMVWGTGNEAAEARIKTLTIQQLRDAGITVEMAQSWTDFYRQVLLVTPNNPSAMGRARLMEYAVSLFKEVSR